MPQPTLIHHFLESSASRFPERIAVIHDGVRTSYAEINARSNALADYLLRQLVEPGARVAIIMENCLEYIVSYYGALKAAAVAVPLNTDLKPDRLRSILQELQPAWILSTGRFERLLHATNLDDIGLKGLALKSPSLSWSGRPFPVVDLEDLLTAKVQPNPSDAIRMEDLASIIFTSGSTGRAKGVMLSHRNIVSNTLSICEYLKLSVSDIQMVVLPFFYVMGKSLLNTHFAAGGTVVINNKFAFPATVLKEMVSEQVTGFSGVPSTYAYLLHRSPLAAYRNQLASLRYCCQAGGHMSRAVKEDLRKALPDHTEIYIMYGTTEAAGRLAYLDPRRYADKMDSIGKAMPRVTLDILAEDGSPVQPGQIGELVSSGPGIMQGYWKDPDATRTALAGGCYHTGDQAYQDSEGFIYLAGRKDEQLKVGGHRVSPHEIEDVLMESGLLVEAVVLGLPDALLDHRLVACAVARNGDTEHQLVTYCGSRLPKFKIPNPIKFVRALPKNTSGKVDRSRCLEAFNQAAP